MSLQEGLNAGFSLGGTALGLFESAEFSVEREAVEWNNAGTPVTSDVLLGPVKYKCTARKGYVDNTFLTNLEQGVAMVGSIFPRGGSTPYIQGSVQITRCAINNMRHDTAEPVIQEMEFIMYAVSHS